MGTGGSKDALAPGINRERRRSHLETNPPPQSEILISCPYCQRNFAEDRIQRHSQVCERVQCRKREVFNTAAQRGGGTNLDMDEQESGDGSRSVMDWRQTRSNLRELLKQARRESPGHDDGHDVQFF